MTWSHVYPDKVTLKSFQGQSDFLRKILIIFKHICGGDNYGKQLLLIHYLVRYHNFKKLPNVFCNVSRGGGNTLFLFPLFLPFSDAQNDRGYPANAKRNINIVDFTQTLNQYWVNVLCLWVVGLVTTVCYQKQYLPSQQTQASEPMLL